MFYTDDPGANWNFDTRAKRPPQPEPTPQPEQIKRATKTWQQLFAAVLDALLPYQEAYAVIRQLTENTLAELDHHQPTPRPA